jgi:hypothetical protein
MISRESLKNGVTASVAQADAIGPRFLSVGLL